ncbi:hypothetical protein ES703_87668 [subsurface metagenome]
MVLIDAPRVGVVLLAQRRSHPDDLAHHPTGSHHSDRAQRHVGNTDVTTCHHQVSDITRIKTAVRNRIRLDAGVFCDGFELFTGEVFGVFRVRIVQVDGPRRRHECVGEFSLLLDVLLLQYNIAQQPAGFALAGNVSYPLEFAVGIPSFPMALVLQERPVAIHSTKPVVADILEFGYLVAVQAGFPVPVSSGGMLATFLGEL